MTLRKLALLLGTVLSPVAMAHADNGFYAVHVCNSGKVEFDVATVERELGMWSYKDWKVSGWYAAEPDKCVNWHTETWEGGFTGHKPAVYLVIAFRDSTGVWGQASFNLKGTKLEDRATDQEICVKQDRFEYTLPTGKISGNCKDGYKPMRASFFFDPAPGGVLGSASPGGAIAPNPPPGPYEFGIELTKDDRAVKFGETAPAASTSKPSSGLGASSSSGSSLTIGEILAGAALIGLAVALSDDTPKPATPKPETPKLETPDTAKRTLSASFLGKKIARYPSGSDWYYEDGSHVKSEWGFDGKTASWLMDAPDQRPTSDRDVAAAFGQLRQTLAKVQFNRGTQIEPNGRFFYTYNVRDLAYETMVNLSAMDYGKARYFAPDAGTNVATFAIPCKELQLCVATLYGGKIEVKDSLFIFFMEGDDKAVWDPLMKLIDFYPAEPTIAVR